MKILKFHQIPNHKRNGEKNMRFLKKIIALQNSREQNFFQRLKKLTPAETIGISDMFLTLVEPDHFPLDMENEIISFLKNGGELVVVTGDAIDTVQKCLLNNFRYKGSKRLTFHIEALFGFECWKCSIGGNKPIGLEKIYSKKPIEIEDRKIIFEQILKLIEKTYGKRPELSNQDLKALFSKEGAQIYFQDSVNELSKLGEKAFLEVRESKVTIVIYGGTEDPRKKSLLNAIYNDPIIRKVINEKQLHIVEPDNRYTEITSITKKEGIEGFKTSKLGKAAGFTQKHRIYTGDSKNDKELFASDNNEDGKALKIFVGKHADFFKTNLNPNEDASFIHLYGEHTKGTARIYQAINKTN